MRGHLLRRLEPDALPSYARVERRGIDPAMTQSTNVTNLSSGQDLVVVLAKIMFGGPGTNKDRAEDVFDAVEALEREATSRQCRREIDRIDRVFDELERFLEEKDMKGLAQFATAFAQDLAVGIADIRVRAFGFRFSKLAPQMAPGVCNEASVAAFRKGLEHYQGVLAEVINDIVEGRTDFSDEKASRYLDVNDARDGAGTAPTE